MKWSKNNVSWAWRPGLINMVSTDTVKITSSDTITAESNPHTGCHRWVGGQQWQKWRWLDKGPQEDGFQSGRVLGKSCIWGKHCLWDFLQRISVGNFSRQLWSLGSSGWWKLYSAHKPHCSPAFVRVKNTSSTWCTCSFLSSLTSQKKTLSFTALEREFLSLSPTLLQGRTNTVSQLVYSI